MPVNKKYIFTAAAAFVGYEIYQLSELLKRFDYSVKNFRITKGTATKLLAEFNVDFLNNSDAALPVSSVSGNIVSRSGVLIGKFRVPSKVILKPRGTTTFKVEFVFDNLALLTELLNQFQTSGSLINFELKVTVLPKLAFIIPVPVSVKRTIQVNLSDYLGDITNVFLYLKNRP
jgi:LEA14-like dessication related protein